MQKIKKNKIPLNEVDTTILEALLSFESGTMTRFLRIKINEMMKDKNIKGDFTYTYFWQRIENLINLNLIVARGNGNRIYIINPDKMEWVNKYLELVRDIT